ncbi:MAG TPA: tRNA (adenosine(37)-N6)-threonylcarbamoyltransferase complex dimerization subunit type 1 TsaB, partial [Acidimicrobiales bacterium]|nr:tRNA (adenosine(37)-N6)-threonylcarbamoyltransferase complex dimerization subunit type 1 TsaB [Acidimicrobiales bacterium]
MIVLGIETATELVGVALADPDGPRAAVWATGRRRHAESLAPAIAHVLDQAGLTLQQVDAVAVDLGPGLFTGLRVGVATAKGLAQGMGLGLLGLASTEVLAAAAYRTGHRGPVIAVVDGRRSEVFAARYASDGDGVAFTEVSAPSRYTPEALAAELSAAIRAGGPEGGWLAVGDGAHRYAD